MTLFVAIDVTLATRSTRDLRDRFWRYPDGDPNALRVEVTARQWSWTFRTAGPGRPLRHRRRRRHAERAARARRAPGLPEAALEGRDPLASTCRTSAPSSTPFPGSTTRLWFQARETGRFEIGCAQHCGVSHYKMRGELAVASPTRLRRLAGARRDRQPAALRPGRRPDAPTAGTGRPDDDGLRHARRAPRPPRTTPATIHPPPSGFWRRHVFSTDHKVIGKQFLFLGPRLPRRRRLHGDADPLAARPARASRCRSWVGCCSATRRRHLAGGLHVAVHDARHDHDLLRHDADPDRRRSATSASRCMIGARDMAFPTLNMLSFWTHGRGDGDR